MLTIKCPKCGRELAPVTLNGNVYEFICNACELGITIDKENERAQFHNGTPKSLREKSHIDESKAPANTTGIRVTIEKCIRISQDYDASDDDMDTILHDGKNPFLPDILDRLAKKEMQMLLDPNCSEADVEYDYRIEDEEGRVLTDWDD